MNRTGYTAISHTIKTSYYNFFVWVIGGYYNTTF